MGQFSQIAIRIQELKPGVSLHAMMVALKPGAFADSLCKKRSTIMDNLRCCAINFTQVKELLEFRDKVRRDQKKPDFH